MEFGINNVQDLIYAAVALVCVVGVLTAFSFFMYSISSKKSKIVFKKCAVNNLVTEGGKLEQTVKDSKYMSMLSSGSPKNAAATAKALMNGSAKRPIRTANGDIRKKLKARKQETSTSDDSSPDSSERTDSKSSSYDSSSDCRTQKAFTNEFRQQIKEKAIPEESEIEITTDEQDVAEKVGTTSTVRPVIKRRKKLRKRGKHLESRSKLIQTWIEGGYHNFHICEFGGTVELPFGRIHFPANAVKERKQLRFILLNSKETDITELLPPVHGSAHNENGVINFKHPVTCEIRIWQHWFENLLDQEEAELQITECSVKVCWITAQNLFIKRTEEFISVKIKRFAGFRVICKNPTLSKKRRLFYALCIKRLDGIADPKRQFMYVHICCAEDSQDCKAIPSNYEIIAAHQVLTVRFPCYFEASLSSSGFISEPSKVPEFKLESHCDVVREYFPIQISKENENTSIAPSQMVPLLYTVSILDGSNTKVVSRERSYHLQWTIPVNQQKQQPAPLTINVTGDKAIGIQQHMIGSNCESINEMPIAEIADETSMQNLTPTSSGPIDMTPNSSN